MEKDQEIKALKAEIRSLKEKIRMIKKEHKADVAQLKVQYRAGIRRRHPSN